MLKKNIPREMILLVRRSRNGLTKRSAEFPKWPQSYRWLTHERRIPSTHFKPCVRLQLRCTWHAAGLSRFLSPEWARGALSIIGASNGGKRGAIFVAPTSSHQSWCAARLVNTMSIDALYCAGFESTARLWVTWTAGCWARKPPLLLWVRIFFLRSNSCILLGEVLLKTSLIFFDKEFVLAETVIVYESSFLLK